MFRPTVLLTLIIALLGVNIFLYRAIRARNQKQDLLQDMLTDSRGIDDFITLGNGAAEKRTWYKASERERNLWSASKQLANKIDTLPLTFNNRTPTNAQSGYFTKALSIPMEKQTDLWDAQRNFQDQVVGYLETEVPRAIVRFRQLGAQAVDVLNSMEKKAASSAEGRWSSHYEFQLTTDYRIQGSAQWTKKNGVITWEDESYDYLSNLARLDEVNASRTAHIKTLLGKLGVVFERPGRLVIYGSTHELSKITQAELISSYKYITLLHLEIVDNLEFLQREISSLP